MKVSSGITFPAATGAYVAATRTLSGLNTTPALDADDGTYKRLAIFFTMAGVSYWGFIYSWTTATTLVFEAGAGLPATDVSIASLFVLDVYDAVHSYQDYLNEIDSLVQDDATKLSTSDYAAILQKAVTDWGKDWPLRVRKKVTGAGTDSYVLNTILAGLWKYGYSKIFSIEYPQGQVPPLMMEDDDWDFYDDGSAQDGSNLSLLFNDEEPSATEYFVVEFNIEPNLPATGNQNFPDTNFNFSVVTTLAASYACDRLATAYAQSTDGTINADVVNYHDKSAKYTNLAKEYRKRYRILLFGSEDTKVDVSAAMVQKEITPKTNQDNQAAAMGGVVSSSYLFHRVRRR